MGKSLNTRMVGYSGNLYPYGARHTPEVIRDLSQVADTYLMPSKLIHPTPWGTRDRIKRESPMYNALNCLHHLMVETILAHRRHFVGEQLVTPIVG